MIRKCPDWIRPKRPDFLVLYKGEVVPLSDAVYDMWDSYYDSPEGQKAIEELMKAYADPGST